VRQIEVRGRHINAVVKGLQEARGAGTHKIIGECRAHVMNGTVPRMDKFTQAMYGVMAIR
jgi:hypothetical protein